MRVIVQVLVGAAIALLAVTAAEAEAAPAWRQVGPCRLGADRPRLVRSVVWQGRGHVDTCGGLPFFSQHDFVVQACLQRKQAGRWVKIPRTCETASGHGVGDLTDTGPAVPGVTWIRTWAWVSVDHRWTAIATSGAVLA